MSDVQDELDRIRAALEAADLAIADALEARALATRALIALRERNADTYFAPPREGDVLAKVRARAPSFPAAGADAVMREVFSASAALMAPVRVAYLGPEGGLAHFGARKQFGTSAELRAFDSVAEVFDEVARGRAMFGVVPLESSIDGAVTATLDALAHSEIKVIGERTVPSSLHLLSKTGSSTDIEKIYAPSSAIALCQRTLRSAFPRAMVIDVPSAVAAADLATEDHGAAALGTEVLVDTHGLRFVKQSVEDQRGGEVRYAVVGLILPSRSGTDRTLITVGVHDTPGALLKVLHPFAERGVNLRRLESRPVSNVAWRYLFFIEVDGHVTDRPIVTALEDLRAASGLVKVIGSYPRPR